MSNNLKSGNAILEVLKQHYPHLVMQAEASLMNEEIAPPGEVDFVGSIITPSDDDCFPILPTLAIPLIVWANRAPIPGERYFVDVYKALPDDEDDIFIRSQNLLPLPLGFYTTYIGLVPADYGNVDSTIRLEFKVSIGPNQALTMKLVEFDIKTTCPMPVPPPTGENPPPPPPPPTNA